MNRHPYWLAVMDVIVRIPLTKVLMQLRPFTKPGEKLYVALERLLGKRHMYMEFRERNGWWFDVICVVAVAVTLTLAMLAALGSLFTP